MKKENFKKAYSLLELSIVIVIISILITGALSVSVGSINNAKIKSTNDRMKEVYKAMGNFLITNRRLPCPASVLKVKTVDSDYGTEVGAGSDCSGAGVYQSTGSTNLVFGMVPVRTLGLSNEMAEDAFESKITYIIHKKFTNAAATTPNFATLTFATTGFTGVITINEKPSGVTQTITNDTIMVLVSHGANKLGAFNANSASQNTAPTDADEANNHISSPNNTPTPKTTGANNIIISSSGNSDAFDDLVFFKSRNDFIEDFEAMFLVPCQNAGVSFGSANANYGQVVYATASCSSPNQDKRLTKKCEAYGSWVDVVAACPS